MTSQPSLTASPTSFGRADTRKDTRLLERFLRALPEDSEELNRLCSQVSDWQALFELAGRHGVEGVLYHHLCQGSLKVPAGVLRRVEQQLAFERLAQSRLLAALDEALLTLHAAGVHAAALKGPVLAERIYPDPTLRLSTDLDLLVAPNDLDRSTAALEAIGYQVSRRPSEQYFRKHHHHIHLSRRHSPPLELHFRAYAGFGVVIASEEFLSRASCYRTARGAVAWVLSLEDELLYLCVHAAGHRFLRLAWLYELKLFLRRHPDLDWSVVESRASSYGLASVLSFALEVLRRRLGVASEACRSLFPSCRGRFRVADFILSTTAGRPASSMPAVLGKLTFFALLCDRPLSAAYLLQHQLFRIARRRAYRYFPRAFPEAWSA